MAVVHLMFMMRIGPSNDLFSYLFYWLWYMLSLNW